MNLSKSLKMALAIRDIKRIELAASLGISPQQVSNWISSSRISTDYIDKICEALDMKPSEFIALGE